MTQVLAIVFTAVLAALAVFQVLLAAGLPFGHFAWGGQHTVLPRRLRIGSALSIFAYAVFALVALERAGVTNLIAASLVAVIAMWVIAAYLVLGVFPNLASKSMQERRVMVPVSAALAVLAILIAAT